MNSSAREDEALAALDHAIAAAREYDEMLLGCLLIITAVTTIGRAREAFMALQPVAEMAHKEASFGRERLRNLFGTTKSGETGNHED